MHNFTNKTDLPPLQHCQTEPTQHYSRRASSVYYNDQEDYATECLLFISENQDKNMDLSTPDMSGIVNEVAPWDITKQIKRRSQNSCTRSKTSMLLPLFSNSVMANQKEKKKRFSNRKQSIQNERALGFADNIRLTQLKNNSCEVGRKYSHHTKKNSISEISDLLHEKHEKQIIESGNDNMLIREFTTGIKQEPKSCIVCVHQQQVEENEKESINDNTKFKKSRAGIKVNLKGLQQVEAIGWLGTIFDGRKANKKQQKKKTDEGTLKQKNTNDNCLTTMSIRQNSNEIKSIISSKQSRGQDPLNMNSIQPLILHKHDKQNKFLTKLQKRMQQIGSKPPHQNNEQNKKLIPKLQNRYIKYSHVKNKQAQRDKSQFYPACHKNNPILNTSIPSKLTSNQHFHLISNINITNIDHNYNVYQSSNPLTKHLYDRYKDILDKHNGN